MRKNLKRGLHNIVAPILFIAISLVFPAADNYASANPLQTNGFTSAEFSFEEDIAVNNKIKYDKMLVPSGMSIGVKVNTKVLVVGYAKIETEQGLLDSPALEKNIGIGDIINKVNNIPVDSSKTLATLLNKFQEEKLQVEIERDGEVYIREIKAVKSSEDGRFKLGLWVRDSTAGVGTLTFFDPENNIYAALGHPITDIDTNRILKVSSGNIVNSSIINVKKGQKGTPGELKGIFINEDKALGTVSSNTPCGIFGRINNNELMMRDIKPMKVAMPDEIKEGKAQIITTVDEKGPRYYDIEILKLLSQDVADSKGMLIKVTDPELLSKTGGIVQGMSGSPIIQNNKIIGAVTHVLVNKPDTGYGIYIQWMVKDANNLLK
ncbi:SpoIVB peptidase [Alloiococcus sp. CFN-8]|uniref:SpoIVB peptidase n=1 Tax=Alloiococcus sp. CFN-8 TaxID=3416081 RepID=UPI003CE8BFAD